MAILLTISSPPASPLIKWIRFDPPIPLSSFRFVWKLFIFRVLPFHFGGLIFYFSFFGDSKSAVLDSLPTRSFQLEKRAKKHRANQRNFSCRASDDKLCFQIRLRSRSYLLPFPEQKLLINNSLTSVQYHFHAPKTDRRHSLSHYQQIIIKR